MKKLTVAKGRIYFCIRAHIQRCGIAPSYREIMTACGLKSAGSIHQAIDVLVRDGWLVRGDKYTSRTISLPRKAAAPTTASLDEQADEWNVPGNVLRWNLDADGQFYSFTVIAAGVGVVTTIAAHE